MAWIKSHQSLATHWKLQRLARFLGVHPAQAIGHLHMFWWWAMDNCANGDISGLTPLEISIASGWRQHIEWQEAEHGNASESDSDFLIGCIRSRFVDSTPDFCVNLLLKTPSLDDEQPLPEETFLHNWTRYQGEYSEGASNRREAAITANHERWHVAKKKPKKTCPLCYPISEQSDSGSDIRRSPNRNPRIEENRIGVTNVTPRRERKKPDAANAANPLVSETMNDLEALRAYPSAAYTQEAAAVKWLLDHGYVKADILACYSWLKLDPFWADPKSLLMSSVKTRIGAWVAAGRPSTYAAPPPSLFRPGPSANGTGGRTSRVDKLPDRSEYGKVDGKW